MRQAPEPPKSLPEKRPRQRLGGEPCVTFTVPLAVVTPIMGGAPKTRDIDGTDVIRAASIRGHLRFWWRALYGAGHADSKALYKAEGALWGKAAESDGLGRSAVEIRVTVTAEGPIDYSEIKPGKTDGDYALWPARATGGDDPKPQANRRSPGTRFELKVTCPASCETVVMNTVRAWILFGGYGGRTRRGVGTLTVADKDEQKKWLPEQATVENLTALFGGDLQLRASGATATNMPSLQGAALAIAAEPSRDAMKAWLQALGWLRDFRQGEANSPGQNRNAAREKATQPPAFRPGRSNWPEADKIRRLSGNGPWAHEPLHNAQPVFPRAAFGLPIISQFQKKDRKNAYYNPPEPANYELRWRDAAGKTQDRLASPLIVKALPLSEGRYSAIALWLNRSFPAGQVILKDGDFRQGRSAAAFDRLVAEGDTPRFSALAEGSNAAPGKRMRTAFITWLGSSKRAKLVIQ